MNQSTKRILFMVMAAIFLLTSCAPAQPTQDPALVQQLIEQSVALTVAAGNAQTAAARPTDTPIPPPTESVPPSPIPALPTATPFVIVPPTLASGGGSSGGNTTPKEFSCDIIRRRPFDNEFFRPGDPFDVKWTIINNGTKTMRAGLDLKYLSGTQMTAVTRVELPEMKPGAQYEVIFDAFAPSEQGNHIMTWIVEGGLCYPYTAIIVEK